MENIKITFVSLDKNIEQNVKNIFSGYYNISAKYTNITQCNSHDVIVSPANSFGQMDGGIDGAISYMLNTHDNLDYIGEKVRNIIADHYYGEQPIGTCILTSTENSKYSFLAHAPTMTIPENVDGTLNVYYAFKSVLCSIMNYNKVTKGRKIKSILTTTFCTGCGEISLEKSLLQMRKAYDVVNKGIGNTWSDARQLKSELDRLK